MQESDFDAIDVTKSELALDGRMARRELMRRLFGSLVAPDSTKLKSQEPYTNEFLKP